MYTCMNILHLVSCIPSQTETILLVLLNGSLSCAPLVLLIDSAIVELGKFLQ